MAETKSQDAIALLKEDHRAVEDLFKEFEEAKGGGRKQKMAPADLPRTNDPHRRSRKRFSIPPARARSRKTCSRRAYVEHDAAKVLIAEIEAGQRPEGRVSSMPR